MGQSDRDRVGLNVGLNVLLIPVAEAWYHNGAIAAAISATASELTMMALGFRLLPHGVLDRSVLHTFLKALLGSGVMGGVVWSLGSLDLIVVVAIGFLVYGAFSFASRLIEKEDLALVGGIIKQRRSPAGFGPKKPGAEAARRAKRTALISLFRSEGAIMESSSGALSSRLLQAKSLRNKLSQVLPWLLAQLYLRRCDLLGRHVRTYGRPVVDNRGTMTLGDKVRIVSRITPAELITFPGGRLEIGDSVFINRGTTISACELVRIGSRCQIGPHTTIMDNDLHSVADHLQRPRSKPVIIEDDVWLGNRVIVLKGVTIGKGSAVGAGSIVTKSIPPHSVAVGVPARVIKRVD